MGVKGLWKLLLPIGRRISIETLEGRILAVDASIWLTQFVKAMRDPDTGQVVAGAHLVGFFRRLCKLRYHGIRPVFVFDGATPEIKKREVMRRRKRREQFATAGGAEIQRLARKLLVENLKKAAAQKQKLQHTSKNASGRAPGAESDVTSSAAAAATAASFDPGFNPGGDQEDVVKQVAEMEDRKQPGTTSDNKSEATASDPLPDEVSQAVDATNGSSDEDDNDWGDVGRDDARGASDDADDEVRNSSDDDDDVFGSAAQQLYDDYNHGGDEFDVDLMANLPASKRKDAVEKAQRRRRMESRKEFMPAAADPHMFSNVQLSNFLKTCKLNRDITTAALKAAQKDNLHDAMASNRGTLVELIREKDGLDEVDSEHGGEHDAGDEEESRSERRRGEALDQGVTPPKKRRLNRQSEPHDDSSDDDMFNNEFRVKFKEMSPAGRVLLDDDAESDDDDGPGGFFPATTVATSGHATAARQPSVRAKAISDSKTAQQEMLDFELALALQEAETSGDSSETELSMYDHLKGPEVIDLVDVGDDASSHDEAVSRGSVVEQDASSAAKYLTSAVAESYEVESGVPSGSVDTHAAGTRMKASVDPVDESRNRATGSPGVCGSVDDAGTARGANEEVVPSCSDGDDDDDVGWEDGATEDQDMEMSESRNVSPACYTPDDEWSATPKLSTADATAAALERGLSTASRLTNWAGVAFRRAMQASGQAASTEPKEVEKQINEHPRDSGVDQGFETTLKRNGSSSTDAEALHHAVNSTLAGDEVSNNDSERSDGRNTVLDEAVSAGKVGNNDADRCDERADVVDKASASQSIQFDDDDAQRWAAERNSRERDMDTITDDMREEVIQLLQLFGVPYIEAPAEAEAQCVALERLGLVHGIVTEDSDVFVFGGKTVYKNIFEEQKYAEVYKADDAAREMRIGQEEIVALALLLGGDYTEGVRGVGIVNAMEILETFDMAKGAKVGLTEFKRWLDGIGLENSIADADVDDGATKLIRFHEKHRTARTRWTTPEGFPAANVIQAYLNPVVDKSKERFTWARPDVDKLITFFQQFVGWSSTETKKYLDPVVAKLESGLRQTRLDSYMKYEDSIQFADVRSKRLRRVLGLSTSEGGDIDESQRSTTTRHKRNAKS